MSRPHFLTLLLSAFILGGCHGGPEENPNTDNSRIVDPPPSLYIDDNYKKPQNAQFIDSPVEGLVYYSPSIAGKTDNEGNLQYVIDEKVSFYLGGIFLGEAMGKAIMTPEDLTNHDGESSELMTTQILQLLQTFDADADPTNGIQISESTHTGLLDLNLTSEIGDEEFLTDAELMAALHELTNYSDWISVDAAHAHFELSKIEFNIEN